jgi:hypothetical protein
LQETLRYSTTPRRGPKIHLAERLRHLAAEKLTVGASSWKDEGG